MKRRIIYGGYDSEWTDAELARWAAHQIAAGGGFSADARAIAMEIDGEIAAVTVWNCFETHNCLMSIASDGRKRWMTREYLFRSFAYPFLQLGLPRVTSKIDEANVASIALCKGCGFVEEGRLREAAPNGRSDILLGLLRRECRWISEKLARHTVNHSVLED